VATRVFIYWILAQRKNAEFLEVCRFFDREICDLSDFFLRRSRFYTFELSPEKAFLRRELKLKVRRQEVHTAVCILQGYRSDFKMNVHLTLRR